MKLSIPGWGLFMAGLVVGALLVLGAGFAGRAADWGRQYASVRSGEFLDTDFLLLRTGDLMRGRIVEETADKILFAVPKGTVEFSREDVKRVDKNYYTRYVRGMW